MGDIESDTMLPKTISKEVPGEGAFSIQNWSELYGGNECAKPIVSRYITYAKNANATTTNEYYPFIQESHNVNASWQVLKWEMDQLNAVRISHIGVLSHCNLETLRLVKTGRAKLTDYATDPWTNQLPMPYGPFTSDAIFNGPARLGRGFWIWNENGSVEIKDTGTAVPAWAAAVQGVEVAIWGNKIALNRGD